MQCDAYAKQPDNQLSFDGLGTKGEVRMKEARLWTREHISEWTWYKRRALEKSSQGFRPSPNFMLQAMRDEFRVSIPNALAPYLARIAMEENPAISFRTARSDADAYTTAVL